MEDAPTFASRALLTASVFGALMCYALGLTVFGPALAPLAAELGVSEAASGALAAWMSAGFIGATFICGPLAERAGLKLPAVIGSVLLAAGFGLIGRAPSYWWAAAGMVCYGVGGGFCEISCNAATAELYPARRASALNALHVFFGIAALAGPRLSGYLIDSGGGWRQVYLLAALASLLPLPLFAALRFPARDIPAGERGVSSRGTLWREPVFVLTLLGIFFYVGAELTINNWGVLYLERGRGWSARAASGAVSNFWIAMTLGRIAVSAVAHRSDAGRVLLVMSAGALAGAVGLAGFSGAAWKGHAAVAACGLFFSGIFATLFAVAMDAFPARGATVAAALTASAGLAILLLAPAAGFIAEALPLTRAFGVVVLYLVLLLGCVLALLRVRKSAPPERGINGFSKEMSASRKSISPPPRR